MSTRETRSISACRPGFASAVALRSATKPWAGVPENAPFGSRSTLSFSRAISGSVENAYTHWAAPDRIASYRLLIGLISRPRNSAP